MLSKIKLILPEKKTKLSKKKVIKATNKFCKIIVQNNKDSLKVLGYYNLQTKILIFNKVEFFKYVIIGIYPTQVVRYLIKKNLFL